MIESKKIVAAVHWLAQFRKRLLVMLLLPIAGAIGVYFFTDRIWLLITRPLQGEALFFMTPVDGLMVKVKVALLGGLVVTAPLICYLLISLCTIHWEAKIRRRLYIQIIPFASLALAGGISFGYRYILPNTVKFLLNCGKGFMLPMLSGNDYLSFAVFLLLTVGLVFELPLALVALSRINLIKSQTLRQKRGLAIFIIFCTLAVLTPTPDVVTLTAIAAPVIFLYELSIWWIFVLEKTKPAKLNQPTKSNLASNEPRQR